jgi:DNA-binding CsgD family transcriptional regulator/PAS domain-containing protein
VYSQQKFLELVELIYRAAGDPTQWTVLLEHLAKAVRGEMGSLHHQRGSHGESNFHSDWNVDSKTIALYTSYYGFRNPLMTTKPSVLRTGTVNTTQTLCGDRIFLGSEYYNDFLRYRNWCQCLALTLRKDGVSSSNITVFRAVGAPPFDEEESELMHALMPHLQRAFQLHNRIQGLERKGIAATDALDHLQEGVVLLDARGRLLFVNRAAKEILAANRALALTPRGVRAAIASENGRLSRLIQGAIATGTGSGLDAGGAMTISRDGLRRPLHVLVTPLKTRTLYLGNEAPVAAIFISDPDRKPVSNAAVLAQLFGLTRAESRLAQILAAGTSLRDAADKLGVAQSTVRSQLKAIFGKTNTKRQSELVRLLLLVPSLAPA